MTSDDSTQTGSTPEASPARTLGQWVTTLAEDALCLAEASQQFAPGAPLRAPLRAGLRHLLHIERLSRGIEALAMLEVSIMLRVTALLASPAEELDSETILRLRADTPLIEELFPEEKEVIWAFCERLIDNERRLPSEEPVVPLAAAAEPANGAATEDLTRPEADGSDARALDAAHSDRQEFSSATSYETPLEGPSEQELSAGNVETLLPTEARGGEGEPTGTVEPATENESDAGEVIGGEDTPATPDAVGAPQAIVPSAASDELVDRVRAWAAGYQAPAFGAKPHDLTRACAFVRTRVSAWSGA